MEPRKTIYVYIHTPVVMGTSVGRVKHIKRICSAFFI